MVHACFVLKVSKGWWRIWCKGRVY